MRLVAHRGASSRGEVADCTRGLRKREQARAAPMRGARVKRENRALEACPRIVSNKASLQKLLGGSRVQRSVCQRLACKTGGRDDRRGRGPSALSPRLERVVALTGEQRAKGRRELGSLRKHHVTVHTPAVARAWCERHPAMEGTLGRLAVFSSRKGGASGLGNRKGRRVEKL